MSHYIFLSQEWPKLYESAVKAELGAKGDPRTACIYARRTLELQVDWIYEHDPSLSRPYRDDLSALIHEPSFKRLASDALFTKANLLRKLGNKAVHDKGRTAPDDGIVACRELFHLTYWLARTYARKRLPDPNLRFEVEKLPHHDPVKMAQSARQAQELLAKFHENNEKLAAKEETIKSQEVNWRRVTRRSRNCAKRLLGQKLPTPNCRTATITMKKKRGISTSTFCSEKSDGN